MIHSPIPHSASPPRLPLTEANLHILNMGRTPSPTKGKTKKDFITNSDPRHRLRDFNIWINRGEAKPQVIEAFIERLRAPREQESPNAKEVVRKQRAAAHMKEFDAAVFLRNDLLGLDAKNGGQDYLEICGNENLERAWLPPTTVNLTFPLEQAQPDAAMGYSKESLANSLHMPSPFTPQEDQELSRYLPCAHLHAPFFTCQFKGAKNPNHNVAQNQGARDGTALVNFLRWMYQTADPATSEARIQESSIHFSATCDMSTVILFVHWARVVDGGAQHFMEEIDEYSMKKLGAMTEFRAFMRNLQDHAMSTRLTQIKAAIPKVEVALKSKPWLLPIPPPSDSIGVTESVSGVSNPLFRPPRTASAPGSVIGSIVEPTHLQSPSMTGSGSGSPPAKRPKRALHDGPEAGD
jgi:hypothetical protein